MSQNFRPGDLGYVIAEMVGGPLDGKRYGDLPVFPDGSAPASIDIPLGGPTGPDGRAVYLRRDKGLDDPHWKYDYTGAGGHGLKLAADIDQQNNRAGQHDGMATAPRVQHGLLHVPPPVAAVVDRSKTARHTRAAPTASCTRTSCGVPAPSRTRCAS